MPWPSSSTLSFMVNGVPTQAFHMFTSPSFHHSLRHHMDRTHYDAPNHTYSSTPVMSLSCSNVLLSTHFSNTRGLFSSLIVTDEISHSCKPQEKKKKFNKGYKSTNLVHCRWRTEYSLRDVSRLKFTGEAQTCLRLLTFRFCLIDLYTETGDWRVKQRLTRNYILTKLTRALQAIRVEINQYIQYTTSVISL